MEPGESPEQALVREIGEELGCPIEVCRWLPGAVDIDGRFVLTVAIAAISAPGEPRPHEHDLVRWLGPDELDDVDWLGPDRPFLADLRVVLGGIQPHGPVARHSE